MKNAVYGSNTLIKFHFKYYTQTLYTTMRHFISKNLESTKILIGQISF